MLESCAEQGIHRFIYCSSASVFGPIKKMADESFPYSPSNIYEQVKVEAEKEVLNFKDKLDVTIIRPGFLYGQKGYACPQSF